MSFAPLNLFLYNFISLFSHLYFVYRFFTHLKLLVNWFFIGRLHTACDFSCICQLTYIYIYFEFQCKEWGYLLKKLFGTGDYWHLVINHSTMLLRQFCSLHKYSGQGFEASHKLHRSLYSKATNHDASAPGQSCISTLGKKESISVFYYKMSAWEKLPYSLSFFSLGHVS